MVPDPLFIYLFFYIQGSSLNSFEDLGYLLDILIHL